MKLVFLLVHVWRLLRLSPTDQKHALFNWWIYIVHGCVCGPATERGPVLGLYLKMAVIHSIFTICPSLNNMGWSCTNCSLHTWVVPTEYYYMYLFWLKYVSKGRYIEVHSLHNYINNPLHYILYLNPIVIGIGSSNPMPPHRDTASLEKNGRMKFHQKKSDSKFAPF